MSWRPRSWRACRRCARVRRPEGRAWGVARGLQPSAGNRHSHRRPTRAPPWPVPSTIRSVFPR
ncbi:MAG TPA: hypothetical protein DCM32_01990 [Xanthomonadaceae bacterium]|nr:hypothetical protein [Xanthomonadaceae bacterium]